MNDTISSEYLRGYCGSAFRVLASDLKNQQKWPEVTDTPVCYTTAEDIEINLRVGSYPRKGLPFTEDFPIEPKAVQAGSYSLVETIIIPRESPFQLHYHYGEHSGLHLQKSVPGYGKVRVPLPIDPEKTLYGLGSQMLAISPAWLDVIRNAQNQKEADQMAKKVDPKYLSYQ